MKFNYLLLGLVIGALVGFFAYSYGPSLIIATIRDQVYWIVSFFLILLLLIGILITYQEDIIRFIFSSRHAGARDLINDVSNAIEEFPFARKSAEKLSNVIRSGSAVYANWSIRVWLFKSIVGIAVAIGGVFATFVLIQQTEAIEAQTSILEDQGAAIQSQTTSLSRQIELLETQNGLIESDNRLQSLSAELQSLNVLSDLRSRLHVNPAQIASLASQYQVNLSVELPKSVGFCGLLYKENLPTLYGRANPSEVNAVADLLNSGMISDLIASSLHFLLDDDTLLWR